MPARLDVLSFRRTYASQAMRPSAFGPGWWTWTECRAEIDSTGALRLRRSRRPAADARTRRRTDAGGSAPTSTSASSRSMRTTQVLRWGRRSRNPNQQWTFRDGLLVEVSGPFVGTTSLRYRARRLIRLEHDSGRSLDAALEGQSCRRDRSSDGRRARFTYNGAGALVAVDNATSPETYEVDDAGRILSITDADGVRTVAMVYDAEGRVVEQTSATGFTTRFDYDAVRRTTLSDPDYNPLSVYTHDEHGRVEMYATGGGFRFTRRFDGLGRVVSQRDPDGRSFTLVDSADRRAAQRGGALVERRRRALRLRQPRPPRPPVRQRRRRRRSRTTATRCSRRGSTLPATRDSPSNSTGATARRRASPTPTASSIASTSGPTGRSPRPPTVSGDTTPLRRRRRPGAVVAVHHPDGRVVALRARRTPAG